MKFKTTWNLIRALYQVWREQNEECIQRELEIETRLKKFIIAEINKKENRDKSNEDKPNEDKPKGEDDFRPENLF